LILPGWLLWRLAGISAIRDDTQYVGPSQNNKKMVSSTNSVAHSLEVSLKPRMTEFYKKAPEVGRSPKAGALSTGIGSSRSVVGCGSPLLLFDDAALKIDKPKKSQS